MGANPFTGVETANLGPERIYFPPGFVGLVECASLVTKAGRKEGDHFFIGEFKILETNMAERPVGSKATWIFNFKHDAALGNVKKLLAALNGIPLRTPDGKAHPRLEEITADVCAYAVSGDQPMAGTKAKLTTSGMVTKGAKTNFTTHQWEPAGTKAAE